MARSKHTTIHSKDKMVDVVYQNNPVYCRSHSVDTKFVSMETGGYV